MFIRAVGKFKTTTEFRKSAAAAGGCSRRNLVEESARTPRYRSVDELVVAGNREVDNPDTIDFARFRNDKEGAANTRREVERALSRFHADTTSRAYRRDLSRVLNARYLQGHGVKVEPHLDRAELHKLRVYLQNEGVAPNVADVVRGVNSSLAAGEHDVSELLLEGEKKLYSERGVTGDRFEQTFAARPLRDLKNLRDFSDAWSTSQGGRFLNALAGTSFQENRKEMAYALLAQHGYRDHDALNPDTVLALLRDIDSEGPSTQKTIRDAVNSGLENGVTDYHKLSRLGNEAILDELGIDSDSLAKMRVSNRELRQRYPDSDPQESRAARTRVLRDLLHALPKEERAGAIQELRDSKADLISAESVLRKHFGRRIRALAGPSVAYRDMGAMQRANFTSSLSRMPAELRGFQLGESEREVKDRLEETIESLYGVEIHRTPGRSPLGDQDTDRHVKDWTVHGLVSVYNALGILSSAGELPGNLKNSTTLCFLEGHTDPDPMLVGARPLTGEPDAIPDRPGAGAHRQGKSEYFGMCAQDDVGNDVVFMCDDALMGVNSDTSAGLSLGESTLVHELGHAVQLGGTPGTEAQVRALETQLKVAEWSSLSDWREPDRFLADGRIHGVEYYYDPGVQVGNRLEVATAYGASDPVEDFAEYTPFFFNDPEAALRLSQEKFLYFNEMVAPRYREEQIASFAAKIGAGKGELEAARRSMLEKVSRSAAEAGLLTA